MLALPVSALTIDLGNRPMIRSSASASLEAGTSGAGITGEAGANISGSTAVGTDTNATSEASSAENSRGSAPANSPASGNSNAGVRVIHVTRADIDSDVTQLSVNSAVEVRADADLSGFIAAQMKRDENLSSVQASSGDVSVIYKSRAKLLGLIPVSVKTTVRVDSDGNVDIAYPWYSFLMATDRAALEAELSEHLDAALAANADAGGESAGASAQFSVDAQAVLVEKITAALEEAHNASASASADVSADVSVETR